MSERGQRVGTDSVAGFPRRAVDLWKKAARAIGVVQTRIVMLLIYLVAVLPVGIAFRLRRDALRLRQPTGGNWTPCQTEGSTLERARQQF